MFKKVLFLLYALCWGLVVGFGLRVFGFELVDHLHTTLSAGLIMALLKSRVETQGIVALYAMLFLLWTSAYAGIALIMCPYPF